jgi:antimicrobial peptide system SdpB family protein
LLALGTAGTLLLNTADTLFLPLQVPSALRPCFGPTAFGFFCLVPQAQLELARWTAGLLLLVVASGWRPRYTGLLHWWLAHSFALSAVTIDGGDQLSAALSLLLVPITLTDGRRWHWQSSGAPAESTIEIVRRLIAISAVFVVRVQLAGVYFHAAIAKFGVEDWKNGTAMYYWLQDPAIGARGMVARLLDTFIPYDLTIPILTWGAMALEVFLFMALTMPKRAWGALLGIALLFHVLIALFFGLASFSLAMVGALVLYLRPVEREFGIVTRLALTQFHLPRLRLVP